MLPTRLPRRTRPQYAVLILVLCTISYSALRDYDFLSSVALHGRRNLAYLDSIPTKPMPYGRAMIDQNYQSLLLPSGIDSSLFRKKSQKISIKGMSNLMWSKGYDEEAACDEVFLFMPQAFSHNGHGSQLNSYLLASMIATFTNRAMVLLEPPNAQNVFKSNSQFGCPPEAWETVMLRSAKKGGEPKRVGWNKDFPSGLTRLIKHPAWLSRGCPVPCQETMDYEAWAEHQLSNNATLVPVPREIKCSNDNGRETNVMVMAGNDVRRYFDTYFKDKMIDRYQPPSLPAAEWALRLGAAPHEARIFGSLTERHDIWDYVSALVARSGIMRFQPWIARDAEAYMQKNIVLHLPLDVPYDAIHVRRRDKLESDAKRFVIKYWKGLGEYDEETGSMPRDYIPFEHYLRQFDESPCEDGPRLTYVATDDPEVVMKEVEDLPKDEEGNSVMYNSVDDKGGLCHRRFKFVFGQVLEDYHIDSGKAKGDCDERYRRAIAGVADLMILARSNVFVGEFNSNWGRLVRTFRLKMNDSSKIMNGARPVLQREMRVAWGNRRPGPPGW